jgi:hypothetical protein
LNIASLFMSLGINVDDKGLGKLQGKINALPSAVLNLKTAFVALTAIGIDKFVESTVDGVVALENFNKQTDLAIDKLQKWQVASQLSDITLKPEQVTAGIQALQKNLTKLKFGQGDVSGFQILGIDPIGKDAFQVLEELRDKIKGLDNATAVNFIERIGLNPQFINVLRTSREEFNQLSNMKFLSAKQRENIVKLGTAITKLKIEFKLMKDQIIANLMPAWEVLMEVAGRMSRGLFGLLDLFSKATTTVKIFTAAMAALLLSMIPYALPFTALLIAVDDFLTYLEGGESIIGNFIEWLKKMGNSIYDEWLKPLEEVFDKIDKFNEWVTGGLFKVDLSESVFGGIKDFLGIGGTPDKGSMAGNNVNSNINNTYNINSTESANDVAKSVVDIQKTQMNNTLATINNGAAY